MITERSGLTRKPINVSDVHGSTTRAMLVECQCGCPEWLIYFVGEHEHLQCIRCGMSYCDGTCHREKGK